MHVTRLQPMLVGTMLGVACGDGLCFESQLRHAIEIEADAKGPSHEQGWPSIGLSPANQG